MDLVKGDGGATGLQVFSQKLKAETQPIARLRDLFVSLKHGVKRQQDVH